MKIASWVGKKCFVTGGHGFIAGNLIKSLITNGAYVKYSLHNEENSISPRAIYWNIKKPYLGEIEKFDYVFHLAAITDLNISNSQPEFVKSININGTKNVLQFAKSSQAKFIYVSTLGVYGDYKYLPIDELHPTIPLEEYSLSKLEGEKLTADFCTNESMDWEIARLFSVYGPGEKQNRIISNFVRQAILYKKIKTFSSIKISRDYIYIDDIVRGLMATALTNSSDIFNIGTGVESTIAQIITTIESLIGEKLQVEIIDNNRFKSLDRSCADITKITKETGWMPIIKLKDGISNIIKNYTKEY